MNEIIKLLGEQNEKRLGKDNIVKTVPITEGMTIYFNNATSYYE